MIDGFADVTGCHEGYPSSEHITDTPVLPLINLENAAAFQSAATAEDTVARLRSLSDIQHAADQTGSRQIVDVAYYNAVLCSEILRQHPNARMVGIIRDCESFVRSCTTLTGTDPLPVGWPDPDKPLSEREAFIGLGRIRPGRKSPHRADWKTWSAIERNIWLWQETNLRIIDARRQFPDRAVLMRFETLKTDRDSFVSYLCHFLDLENHHPTNPDQEKASVNKKPFGYQVGPSSEWTPREIEALKKAQTLIDESTPYDF